MSGLLISRSPSTFGNCTGRSWLSGPSFCLTLPLRVAHWPIKASETQGYRAGNLLRPGQMLSALFQVSLMMRCPAVLAAWYVGDLGIWKTRLSFFIPQSCFMPRWLAFIVCESQLHLGSVSRLHRFLCGQHCGPNLP